MNTYLSLLHSICIVALFSNYVNTCWVLSIAYFISDSVAILLDHHTQYKFVFLLHHFISITSLWYGFVPSFRFFDPMCDFFIAAESSNIALNLSKLALSKKRPPSQRFFILLSELIVYGWFRCVVIGNIVLTHVHAIGWLNIPALSLYAMGVVWTFKITNQLVNLYHAPP